MSQKSRANSPCKGTKKTEQKVQFAEFKESNLKDPKQSGKPPEIPRHTSGSSGSSSSSRRLNSASSLNNLPKENSNSKTFSRVTNSLERQHSSRSTSSNRTSPIHRKRPGSFTRQRNETPSTSTSNSELKRTQSFDKRHLKKISQENDREKRNNSELRDSSSKEKSGKPRHTEDRSSSAERHKQRAKNVQPILTQNGVNKHAGKGGGSIFNRDHPFNRSIGECSQKLRRAVSRSPKRNFNKENDGIDKENEKLKDKNSKKEESLSYERQSRTRTHKRDYGTDILPPHGKAAKQEHFWKFERDVMWTYNSSGGKRAGYLLLKCAYLEQHLKDPVAKKYGITFKFSQGDSKLIRILLEAHGFKEVNTTSSFFNLYWGTAHFSPNEIRQLQDWQKINHFPRSSELTRKDRLYMNIKRMQRQFGMKLFDFIPTSFVLPTEYREFCDTHLRERGIWIVKPVASSQGKGIYLVSQVDQVPPDETSLVCRYLDSPLLVDGYKCDLRLYVVVTSLDPLVVYLYEEGLVRLATIKYQNGKNLWNPCIHLTNYSVNKFHSNYVHNEDPEVDDRGNKWSLSAFLRHLKARGTDTGALMRGIEDVIIKSILSASYQMNTATNMFVPHARNCFELYGFDILIDNQLKPWVLEVNLSPSLNMDQPLDLKIKSAMLADLFSLIGIQVCNPNTTKVSTRPPVYRKLPNLRHSTESIERSQFGGRFGSSTSNGGLAPSPEELRLFRQLREEYERRGGWARICPTPDSWAMYGSLQEYDSPLNLVLHLHLYPNIQRNSRYFRVAPLKMSSVSSSGLASSLERLNCYERALPKGLLFLKNKFSWGQKQKQKKEVCKDLHQVKASLVHALENGLTLSKYQARMAFSVYLQHVQRRLMIGCDQERQTDLVYRFLRSATRTLHLPFNVQAPSKTLPHEARAVVISKQLGDFIQAYTKETHLYLDQQSSASCSSLSSQCPNSSVPTPSEPSAHTPLQGGFNAYRGSTTSLDSSKDMDGAIPTVASTHHTTSDEDMSLKDSSPPPPSSTSVSLLSVNSLSDASSVTLPSVHTTPSSISRQTSTASMGSFHGHSFASTSSSSSLNKPSPPSASASSTSISTIDGAITKRVGFFQSRLRRFKSDGDSGICSTDDEGTSKEERTSSPAESEDHGRRKSSSADQDDGIAMELYRVFLSNAGESDLEEVLALHTRIHNSAGVFLDPARRGRTSASSGNATPSASASPHGSPRRARRSPVHGERGSTYNTTSVSASGSVDEPVTNEPHSSASSMKRSPSGSGPSFAASVPSSTCCLFGNILKASLKGTKTAFNP